MSITFTEENIHTAATLTFWNVVFLSAVCTAIDGLRRKFTVDKPVKKILAAADRIIKGDYSVRIEPLNGINRSDGLDKVVDCFNKMAAELSGVETLQTDFISNVSHELKTPLAVMQNYGTLLSQSELSQEERLRYAAAISEGSRRLAELISNILKLNKLENCRIFPAARSYNLSEQLCECLLGFEHVWEQKGLEIETDLAEDVIINADPELLSLVWNNLISNALKFTDSGTVSVSLKATGEAVEVAVSDTGCGISPDTGKHIFDKFYQGDASRATQGNGLGLALVHRVINIVGGDIDVTSEVGKGSTFKVRLRAS